MSELEELEQLTVWIRTACRWEVLAPKPGNVHPGASFADLTAEDFLQSADVIAPVLAGARAAGVGPAILEAVQATQGALGRNTNLGIVLLIAPLAAVPPDRSLGAGITGVLEQTSLADASCVYRAIRCAQPGGLGDVDDQDVSGEPTQTLVEVMRLAADRDRIAAQYANGFRDVLETGVPQLLNWVDRTPDTRTAIVGLHLALMSQLPDTLIARKCGANVSAESARRARDVLVSGWPDTAAGAGALADLDRWLRADGHQRNPGTTADLVAATLFAAQRDAGWNPGEPLLDT